MGALYLDPTEEEEEQEQSDANVMISYMANLNEITQIFLVGDIQRKHVEDSIELCLDGCSKIHEMMRITLLSKST
jgi:ribonuclease PH